MQSLNSPRPLIMLYTRLTLSSGSGGQTIMLRSAVHLLVIHSRLSKVHRTS